MILPFTWPPSCYFRSSVLTESMSDPADPQTSERQQTDQSLQVERQRTDAEIGKRDLGVKERSESVVEVARDRADEVLAEARIQADAVFGPEAASTPRRMALREERAVEDATLASERLTADQRSETELEERTHALEALLAFEREQTDERLLIERARGDASLLARDNFMGMVSHDLRNLLGGIALGLAKQIRNPSQDDAGRDNLKISEKIQRMVARINRLVGDLMDVTSIESGRFAVVPVEQDARGLLKESLDAFAAAASAKHIALVGIATTDPLIASFDRDRIFQVMANLLANAIKFTGEGGHVTVRAEHVAGQLRFSVSDTGVGMAEDELERIFDRFWQIQKGDRRGMGLGLFISRCIIESHGGKLWAESRPGEGSTFLFTLPSISEQAHAHNPERRRR
jgi:signal transduction histidine kinase